MHRLNYAIRLCASTAVLACAGFVASPALAADATATATATSSEQSPTTVSDIVVTGTNIRGVAPVGSTLTSITKEDIVAAGGTSVSEILQQVPQIFNIGISETNHGGNGGSGNVTDGTSIDLRGLGAFATLTIIDGHRTVPQGTSGQSIDPSNVPTNMLDHVEIIDDGSSAVYGSDAVAGVVNLILKRNVEGLDVTARYGGGNHYDEYMVGILAGHKWDSGQLTVAYEHGYHSDVNGAYRSWYGSDGSSKGGTDFRSTQCNPGTLTIAGKTYALPAGGVTQATAATLLPVTAQGTVNKCDLWKTADLLPSQRHDSVAFTFDDTYGKFHFFADGYATDRGFHFKAVQPAANITIPSTSPNFILPPGVTATTETVAYDFNGMIATADPNGYSRSFNVSGGFDYSLPHDFRLTAMLGFGTDADQNYFTNGLTGAAINAAAAAGTLNPFQPSTGIGSNTQAQLANTVTYMPGGSNQQVYDLKLDGPLFKLPAGDVKIAAGGEYAVLNAHIGTPPSTPSQPNDRFFYQKVTSWYGELAIPITSPEMMIPGFYSVDFDAQVRGDNYDNTSSYGNKTTANTVNPKFGVNWKPFEDLKLRASYGTSFRAPSFFQVYGNSAQLFSQTVNGQQTIALSGPNFAITPETSRTWTIGADWQPKFAPGLKVSLTYWDLLYKNQISNQLANTTTLLSQQSQFAGTGIVNILTGAAVTLPIGPGGAAFSIPADTPVNQMTYIITHLTCPLASGGASAPGGCAQTTFPGASGFSPTTATIFIDGRNKNLSVTKATGLDFDVSYRMSTDHWGDFGAGLAGTYFLEYKVAPTAVASFIDLRNVINNPQTLRMRGNVNWHMGPYVAGVFVNYTNGYKFLGTPVNIGSYTTVDLHAAYTLNKDGSDPWTRDIQFGLDVSNLFDENPPFVNSAPTTSGGGGWDPQSANPIGRVVSISVEKKF
jgi:iron complex outermembrane receptor protein